MAKRQHRPLVTPFKLQPRAVQMKHLAQDVVSAVSEAADNLNADNLTIGTVPDARFPAVLPAVSGEHLTNLPPAPASAAQNTYLVTGGQIVWLSAYEFRVSAASYFINGTRYDSAEDTVTLSAAHATLDRIDVIAVDSDGAVVVVPGTAAEQPAEPEVDPATQLKRGFVYVAAASVAPAGATDTVLYAENAGDPAEWDWTTSGGGFNVNSTNNPRTGSKAIEGTTVANGAYAQGQIGSGTILPNDSLLLAVYIRSKATWNNNRGLAVSFRLNGALVGSAVTIQRSGTWGFESSNTADYQLVAIPISAFSIPAGATANQLRIADFGGAIGFYLDDISLQGGAVTQTPTAGLTKEQADVYYAPNLGLASQAEAEAGVVNDKYMTPLRVAQAIGGSSTRTVGITIDGAGSVITTGVKGFVVVPFSGTITKVTLLSTDASATAGDIVIDVLKDSYANYPPTGGDSIAASAKPTLSSANKSQDSTLTGWTPSVTAGDILGFTVDSASAVTRVSLTLEITT